MSVNKTVSNAYWYAHEVRHGMIFKEGSDFDYESIIATDARVSYNYAINLIRGPWPEGETVISLDPKYAYLYARDVIKGRWLPGELVILFSKYALDYAKLCERS